MYMNTLTQFYVKFFMQVLNNEIKTEHNFKRKQDAAKFLGMCEAGSSFIKLCKTGKPFEIKVKNQHTKKLEHLIGTIIIEHDTEVIL